MSLCTITEKTFCIINLCMNKMDNHDVTSQYLLLVLCNVQAYIKYGCQVSIGGMIDS